MTKPIIQGQIDASKLLKFIKDLESLKQASESRGDDLTLSQYQRESCKSTAAAYAFCLISLKSLISQKEDYISFEDFPESDYVVESIAYSKKYNSLLVTDLDTGFENNSSSSKITTIEKLKYLH
jgi:hypothetical protein